MTNNSSICRLCEESKELKLSHSIPRSFFRAAKKGGGGQLTLLTGVAGKPPVTKNFDPKDLLLCNNCETKISNNYEKYGIEALRNKNIFQKKVNFVKVKNLNNEKFYLFLISIFWRMSKSNHSAYSGISLTRSVEDFIRNCLIRNNTKIIPGVRLNQLLPITILKIHEPLSPKSKIFDQIVVPAQMSHRDNKLIFFTVFGGYLIILWIEDFQDIHDLRTKRIPGAIPKNSPFIVNYIDIRELKEFKVAIRNSFLDKSNK